jgi:hypothetical protein
MDFKLLSKNNVGIASTLILVVLLSQSRVLDFLIDTTLGRFILILFILGISYSNKILGVVSVLLIILVINQSDMRFFEGFADGMPSDKPSMPSDMPSMPTKTTPMPSEEEKKKEEPFEGREGFNMIDREGTILKGKRSNEVPVLSEARSQDEVDPSDKAVFTSSFASV